MENPSNERKLTDATENNSTSFVSYPTEEEEIPLSPSLTTQASAGATEPCSKTETQQQEKPATLPKPTYPTPFTTPTDVIQQLNAALLSLEDDRQKSSVENRRRDGGPKVELQRKFDDGSTRPATQAERKAADFNSKIKQVAHHLSLLSTKEEKFHFLESQLQYGNQLYHLQQYEEAIDVYLTCLVGVQPSPSLTSNVPQQQQQQQQHEGLQPQQVLLARILNNLAQSALQLHWYQKCIRFCTMALDQLVPSSSPSAAIQSTTSSSHPPNSPPDVERNGGCDNDVIVEYVLKFYFKRAKAHRLIGLYSDARRDLKVTQTTLSQITSASTCKGGDKITSVDKAIQKEWRLLTESIQQGQEHQRQQQQAMQQLLSQSTNRTKPIAATNSSGSSRESVHNSTNESSHRTTCQNADRVASTVAPLYSDRLAEDPTKRSFSTLRAPSDSSPRHRNSSVTFDDSQEMATESCGRKLIRLARHLRRWLQGENDDDAGTFKME